MARPALRKRRWTSWLIWIPILAAGVFGVRRVLASRQAAALPVRVHSVERGPVRDLVSTVAAGRVAAHREATLRAEIAGTIVTLHVRRGDRVAAGAPLITYDPSELRDRVRVADAAVALARAQAAQAEASARVAGSTMNRARGLRDHGVTAPADVENLEGQFDVATRAAAASRSALGQASANVLVARDALRRAVLRAPFAGVVLTTSVEQGEVTTPGAPVLALADTSELHVDGELDEADLGRVALGMPSEVTLDAFPGQRFAGTLTEIAPSVTRDVRGNRSVAIRVELAPDPRLRVGMSADVDVVVARRENVLWVPPTAVMGRGTDRSVYVVQNGIARRRRIDVGIATWESLEVTGGLREGDPVIVTLSAPELGDGTRVASRQDESSGRGTREGAVR